MQSSQLFIIIVLPLVAIVVYLGLRKLQKQQNSSYPETGDPVTDADYQMAYGQYKNAKNLVEIALQREPQRTDLKMKLLEVCFVWGNESEFVSAAKRFERDLRAAGEWDKVEIMGKQVALDDFS